MTDKKPKKDINNSYKSIFYIKNGKRYIPAGVSIPDLTEGIWYVKLFDGGKSSTNLIAYCPIPDKINISKEVSINNLAEIITSELTNNQSDSIQEKALKIARLIIEKFGK